MIALIPARGGSKGLPGKNIKYLNGKPLIAYTIEAAMKSRHISRVIVSTDDEEIARISMLHGAEVPFLRPVELAGDHSKAIDAYLYTVQRLMTDENICINEFAVLLPTSPLRGASDIDNAVELFISKKADSVISLVESNHPPTWYKRIDETGVIRDFFKDIDGSLNRQEVPSTFIPNGAIYIFQYDFLEKNRTYYGDKTFAYIMSRMKSIDIDTELDFLFAEFLLERVTV